MRCLLLISLFVILIVFVTVGSLGIRKTSRVSKEFYQTHPIRGKFMQGEKVLVVVDLELARTPKQIEQGLMYRTHLAPNTGMLFWFEDEVKRSFWMRNTLIPLDMIFINSAGRITNIVPSVPPKTETLRHSTEPVQYVVELPGGTAEQHGLQAGTQFVWTY